MDLTNIEVINRSIGPNSMLNHLRQEGFIPGVLYGIDQVNQTIQVNKKELKRQLRQHGKSGIFTVEIEGTQVPVKINEIQRNPVDGEIIHVDLQSIDMKKIVFMSIPIQIFGTSKGVKSGGTIQQQIRELEVKALPHSIPESIHVSIADLDIGDALFVRDLAIPEEVEVLHDENSVILTILPPKMSVDEVEQETPKDEPEIVNARDGHGIDAAK